MTPTQCRMARAALGLTTTELGRLAGISDTTVTNFEWTTTNVRKESQESMQKVFEDLGIQFFGSSGVTASGINQELVTPKHKKRQTKPKQTPKRRLTKVPKRPATLMDRVKTLTLSGLFT